MAVTAAAALLFLTACGGTAEPGSETSEPGAAGGMPTISGEFGQTPEFTWPDGAPSTDLEVEVLSEGDGDEVEPGSHVVADYAGHVFGNDEPFDSSFARGAPTQFPLNNVVEGWRDGIPGHKAGSRLLISIPPEFGYGPNGNPGAGIGGEDTIVFVVDVLASFTAESFGEPDAPAVEGAQALPVEVEGELGAPFSVEVEKGAPEPTEPLAVALSEGSGPKVEAGQQAVIAYALTTWDNETTESTWMEELGPNAGPQTIQVGAGSAIDLLEGFEVGSRVLITQVGADGVPAMAIVADILFAY